MNYQIQNIYYNTYKAQALLLSFVVLRVFIANIRIIQHLRNSKNAKTKTIIPKATSFGFSCLQQVQHL